MKIDPPQQPDRHSFTTRECYLNEWQIVEVLAAIHLRRRHARRIADRLQKKAFQTNTQRGQEYINAKDTEYHMTGLAEVFGRYLFDIRQNKPSDIE
jgi:hypothetical protein